MALENYRIIEYPEKTEVDTSDYMLMDSESNGTNKYQMKRIITEAEAKVAAAVAAEAEAREAADEALQTDINTRATKAELAAETAAREQADADLRADLSNMKPGLSDEAKVALLACFQNIALWKDGNGQQYIDELETALYETGFPKIDIRYNPGTHIVYIDDALDTLIPYLTVTYYETEESTGVVIPSSQYYLSGTLREGTTSIRVTYGELSGSFLVTAVDFYNQYEWSNEIGNLTILRKKVAALDANTGEAWININPDNNFRAAGVATNGQTPYVNYSNRSEALPYFPIPVPADATEYTISGNDSQYVFAAEHYVLNDGKYSRTAGGFAYGSAGSRTMAITPAENTYLMIMCKPSTDNTIEFSEGEPSGFTLVFSK